MTVHFGNDGKMLLSLEPRQTEEGIRLRKPSTQVVGGITIGALLPEDGDLTWDPTQPLTLTMSEDCKEGIGYITIYDGNTDLVVQAIDVLDLVKAQFVGSGVVVIFPDGGLLVPAGVYYVKIDDGAILDMVDNAWAGINDKTTWNFGCA